MNKMASDLEPSRIENECLKADIEGKEVLIEEMMSKTQADHDLSADELCRYSRQIFVKNIGVEGQEKLKHSRVLIVGCGGLGCPAALYLAGVGVGKIGFVDYDEVELSNLHRQVCHTEASLGSSKVTSLAQSVRSLNHHVITEEHSVLLSSTNALDIISSYDVVIDCTDNAATRYLLNDACCLSKKPLVSGAAVQMEGQLTVYNYLGGPCYRCLFPEPPHPDAVANCGDVGVLPPAPGLIGVLEALQAVHIILDNRDGVLSGRMLLFDAADTSFRCIKLRDRSSSCAVCGVQPTITSLIDYEQFCRSPANDKMKGVKFLVPSDRLSATQLQEELQCESPPFLVDVRSRQEFSMCRIPRSINLPLGELKQYSSLVTTLLKAVPSKKVLLICRRGNDSQLAVMELQERHPEGVFVDVLGGLHAWAKHVDPSFPVY